MDQLKLAVTSNQIPLTEEIENEIDEAFKLPDDGFVINLKSLTKEYDEFAKQNSFKRNLTLPYICKVI